MIYRRGTISNDLNTLPKLPAWVASLRAETLVTVGFRFEAVGTARIGR